MRPSKIYSGILGALLFAVGPLVAEAGYSEPSYYGQTSYYSQGSYLTLTKLTKVLQSVDVTGAVSKGSGSFVIDHPLDPLNKLLYHSFVESPDVKNMYDGIAELDEYGYAAIELPEYFLSLNTEYRYLVTGIREAMPNLHLAEGVHRKWRVGNPIFEIAGGEPNGTISWQVTGIRKDPAILAFPIITEVKKGPGEVVERGHCLFGPLCE